MSIIFERASVRYFKDAPVEPEKLDKLLRAAMAAPSAINQQPWEFVVVTEPAMLKKLGEISPPAAPAGRAPLVIAILEKLEDTRAKAFRHQDLGACAENILLEAVAQGLGGVWMGVSPVRERIEQVRELLNVPETLDPFCLIAIGYPENEVTPADRYDEARVHYETY